MTVAVNFTIIIHVTNVTINIHVIDIIDIIDIAVTTSITITLIINLEIRT